MIITGLMGTTPEELNLETMQLLLHFFTVEELVNDLHVLDLSARELTVVRATILQEMAGQLRQQAFVRDAVKSRVQTIFTVMRPHD
jgi:hypothetical protein